MNPELSIISSIGKLPHSIEDMIWLNCKNYKNFCYLPQVLPFDGPALMQFITKTLKGGTFKFDLGKKDPEILEFEASGTIIRSQITPLIKTLTKEFREQLAEKIKMDYPPNTPFSELVDKIPKKSLSFKYDFFHNGNCITFLEYMPHLLGLASALSNIILTQNDYYQGDLDLVFHHGYKHSEKSSWIELVNNLKELRVDNDWDFKYPRLLVNKNVKDDQFYKHEDFSLLK